MSEHKVRVYLLYTLNDTPYKWSADCTCGWHALSWSWWREYDCYVQDNYQGGNNSEQWIKDNGEPYGGAYAMAYEHVTGKVPHCV